MSSFVTINYSTQHAGAARVESVMDAAKQLGRSFSGSRGLAALLLSAMVAAVVVIADQVMDSVAEGHLLVIWMALWAVAFVALALLAGATRQLAKRVFAGLDGSASTKAQASAAPVLPAYQRHYI